MKSFPSSFTKNPLVQDGLLSVNAMQTVKNIADKVMQTALSGGEQGVTKESLGEGLEWREHFLEDSIKISNYANISSMKLTASSVTSAAGMEFNSRKVYENAFKIPADVLRSINKYRYMYKSTAFNIQQVVKVDSKGANTDQTAYEFVSEAISPSLFNPFFGVRTVGFVNATPKMNVADSGEFDAYGTKSGKTSEMDIKVSMSSNVVPDFTDCSTKKLVELSNGYGSTTEVNDSPLGRALYKWADFMYCRDAGKISNNHLITLRKFTHPVGDNIFTNDFGAEMVDTGRLVAWFGNEENKLEDICKYNYKATWKELNSEIQSVNSKEDDDHIGSSVINLLNPAYRAGVAAGTMGGGNSVLRGVAKHGFLEAQEPYGVGSDYYYLDKNKVWEPKNTIQRTHIYEGKLEFAKEFTLTFNYEMRHYDGINGKNAFLDLLGNILEVTYKRGRFWGGSIRWLGAPRNKEGWRKMNSMIDRLENGGQDFIDQLASMSSMAELGSYFQNIIRNAIQGVGELMKEGSKMVKDAVTPGTETNEKAKAGAANVAKSALQVGIGMLKNKLGRPAVYAINSTLSGAPVGLWHVTIGNPRNPILSIGDLILTNAEIEHYGPLGIDDFPTKLKVTVSLKNAKPRDITDIGNMYTCGQGNLLLPLSQKKFDKYFMTNNKKAMAELGFNDEMYGSTKANDMNKIMESLWANL